MPRPRSSTRSAQATEARRLGWFLIRLLIVVVAFRSLVVAPFSIPSESMVPRLLIGDYLLVAKWPYGYTRHSLPFAVPLIQGRLFATLPERGDVVVFKAPPTARDAYVKRVIGLPGDTVQLRGGVPILNGVALPRERIADFTPAVTPNSRCFAPGSADTLADGTAVCRYRRYRETLPGGRSYTVLDLGRTIADDTPRLTVPAGQLFMLGDNRDRSLDSRFVPREGGGIGFVPLSNVVGRVLVLYFSTDGSAKWRDPSSWVRATRGARIGESL